MENIGDLAYLADKETLPTENVGQQLQAYHICTYKFSRHVNFEDVTNPTCLQFYF